MPPDHMNDGFSKLRSWVFPVHMSELKLVIPMGLMMILISFNFWLLHISKDTLIITAEQSGAEVINFLKLPVFIVSIVFVMGFTWMSNHTHQKTIFYAIISFFMLFCLGFTYYIYPHQETLNLFTPAEIITLKQSYPYFKWLFPVVGYWGHSLFYIVAELWGAIVLSMLFWQFANQITTIEQSRRFYMLLGTFNGLGTIIAGFFIMSYEKTHNGMNLDVYGDKLRDLLLVFCLLCLGVILLYAWVNKYVANTDFFYNPRTGKVEHQDEIKLSFVESFRYILKSRYVGYIAIISIAYNIAINCVEVTWKSQINDLYHDALAMEKYFAEVTVYMGILIAVVGLFGVGFVRRFSWKISSLMTPYIMLVMTTLFFFSTMWGNSLTAFYILGMTPLALSVWLGQAHNLLSKSCKYSFFAATREMAFVPLDAELKVKGKAAVDILSGRVGKFGGSLIQSILLSIPYLGTQALIAPYLLVICLVVFLVWILSITALNKEFLKVAYGSSTAPE